eukprot:symbB.v1.2.022637.t1/scaffold2023.1/size92131/2
MGLPCNELQRILVEEKTFEAPLSLFIQYFSAFWLAGNDEAFFKLWLSIFLSSFGISSGLYLSNHVAIIDFEDLNDDAADTTAHPSSQQIGQVIVGTVPPWPPSQPGQAKLPPPPGLVFPERYFQPCPPNGRQGQQGLATEWSMTEPTFMIPTVVANAARKQTGSVHISQSAFTSLADADFYIGDEAYARKDSPNYLLSSPVSKGRIENWDDMERFLQQAIFRNLRCIPEEHDFLLTEPPFNTPENRELMAEMMFETFNVKGLYIGVQAVLALYAQWVLDVQMEMEDASSPNLTGLVVDSGEGLSHVIPVADGYVISLLLPPFETSIVRVNSLLGHQQNCQHFEAFWLN